MADGTVTIKVDAETKQAQSELAKLERELQKAAAAMEKTGTEKNAIADQLELAKQKAAETRENIAELKAKLAKTEFDLSPYGKQLDFKDFYAAIQTKKELTSEIEAQNKLLSQQDREITKLEAKDASIAAKLREQTAEYEKQQEKVGEFRSQMIESGENGVSGSESLTESVKTGLLKKIFSLAVLFQVLKKAAKAAFAAVRAGFSEFAKQDAETKRNIDNLKASLNGLKLALGSAFAPIINAIIPWLIKLVDWLTTAANAISQFFAVLSGKTTYKKAVKNLNSVAGAAGGAGDAAEEAKRQIMGFDEINRLEDNRGGGGGGGGGGGLGDLVEEAVDMDSFPAKLAFTMKDVLFKWKDLTPEDIAAKCLAGLIGLGGAIVGGMIGGVPGAVIGLIAGLLLGCALDATIFNFDGELSKEEIFAALRKALPIGLGLLVGAAVGGPLGAAIGMTLGMLISFDVIKIDDIKGKITEWYEGVKEYFQQYIDKWSEMASEDSKEIGFNVVMGILEGIFWKLADLGAWIKHNLVEPLVNTVKELLGIQSPSTVFAEIGQQISAGLLQGIEEKWRTITQWFQSAWNTLKGWWESLSLGSFYIPHPRFEWTYEQAGGLIARALEFVGLPPTIPHLNISWFAKGGIVNGATLFGAGEAGREAIIPLERNTGWIKKVAEDLLAAMESKFGGAMSGMPAMAMGGIAPPRALNSSGSMFSDGDIERLVSGIASALGIAGGDNVTKLYLDGRQIAEAVTKHQNNMNRGTGR